jgi:hypothetical protein
LEAEYSVSNRVLGSGICGTVYLASEFTTKQQLACKVVDLRAQGVAVGSSQSTKNRRTNTARAAEIRRARQRFFHEIEMLSLIDHVCIILTEIKYKLIERAEHY